jgi:endoglucanase
MPPHKEQGHICCYKLNGAVMTFIIKTGVNISHWLSQSKLRGTDRAGKFTKDDVKKICDAGFDHVRMPVDEVQLWKDDGAADNQAFDLLNEGIYRCREQNMRSIVDMHILKSHYFNDNTQPKLYTDEKELDHFRSLWIQLAERLAEWSSDVVAFEILNEPKAEKNEDWNRISGDIYSMLRKKDNTRTIILGSNWFCMADTFDALSVPDDDNLILTFHFYDPMLITHHQAYWTPIADYKGPVDYPGIPVEKCHLDKLPEPLRSNVAKDNINWNRDVLAERLKKPIAAGKRTGHSLYCGEFGCIKLAPEEASFRWYSDIVSIFRDSGIAYTHWDLRGDFGIFDGSERGRKIIDILR